MTDFIGTVNIKQAATEKIAITLFGGTIGLPGTPSGLIKLGGTNISGMIRCHNNSNVETIFIDGQQGDIKLKNADCAEEFDLSSNELTRAEPGTVMVVDDNGKLQASSKAYDRRVAGVISGGGEYKPGIILDKKISGNPRIPLAIVGKVFCKVDASYSHIDVGDMLTTSPTLGYAMKATNRSRAFGAVIGKSLQAANSGTGLIPILIALQ